MIKMLRLTKIFWRARRLILGFLIVLMMSPVIFLTLDKTKSMVNDLSVANRLVQNQLKVIRQIAKNEKGEGCIMPKLDPFFQEIESSREDLPKMKCEGTDWVNCHKSECNVVKEILETVKDLVCIYRAIIYVDERNFIIGNPTKVVGDGNYALNSSDHVKVDCTGKDLNGYNVRTSWSGYKTGFRPMAPKPTPSDPEDSYNVMILCFDSMSHNDFIRNMQKSYKYLTKKLNAVFLDSYNIVSDGTTGALYPILTGKPEDEQVYQTKNYRIKHIVPEKFIFHLVKGYGYRTAYFEDMPWTTSYQIKFNWLRNQPADHYLRALLLAVFSNGGDQEFPNKHCMGPIPQYQFLLNLAEEFLESEGKKFCFTLINDVTHENYTVVPTADEALQSFLQTLSTNKVLEDTLVIIMGDHGSRYSAIRNTYQGKLEELLPLMAILLPEKMKKRRPTALTALKNNTDVLTTPNDIHATILDVLDIKNSTNKYKIPGSPIPRAMSLLEPIPKTRSCGEAGVMPHWCACNKWANVSKTSSKYQQVANVLARYIDSVSQEKRSKCARRYLISIEWVIHQTATDNLSKVNYFEIKDLVHVYKHTKALTTIDEYYQAKVVMSPGNSVFEGTMIYNAIGDYYMVTQRDISRVNPYGDEPNCISATHPHLNKFCYCKDKLEKIANKNNTFISK